MGVLAEIKAERGAEFPRRFTADVADFGDWAALEPLYAALADGIAAVENSTQLTAWLGRRSELEAVLDEEGSRRYIAMTCDTADADAERAYLDFVENIVPRLKPWEDKLDRLYLACPARAQADRRRAQVMDRMIERAAELYREENIPLQTELSVLGQQFQKISGAMTVEWRGQERTIQQMAPLQEETDRAVREEAFLLCMTRRLADRAALNDIFANMLDLRARCAKNAGYENYRDFRHVELMRFEYTPEDCVRFQRTIEEAVVPLASAARASRRAELGLAALRPWDTSVDVTGRPPLKPFADAAQLEAGCAEIFKRVDPALGAQFDEMRRRRLLDLDSRKGKAPGGYQSTLAEVRLPFIFMNAAGTNRDLFTLLHEGGHAFHAFAYRDEPWNTYRNAPIEFAEVASMTMELFSLAHLGVFYQDEADARRARRKTLEDILDILPWIATVDAFQHWIYTTPGHTAAERDAKFVELDRRFSPGVDWSGLEEGHGARWHRQIHLFETPFYYIEYGIAQLGALQLWLKYRENPADALAGYRRALALGNSRPLPELFEAAGIRFDFGPDTLRPVVEALREELAGAE